MRPLAVLLLFLLAGFASAVTYANCAAVPAAVLNGRSCVPISSCQSLTAPNTFFLLSTDLNPGAGCMYVSSGAANSVLDLNGHTITYGQTGFDGLPNFNFESGPDATHPQAAGWDFSAASHGKRVKDPLIRMEGSYTARFDFTDAATVDTLYSDPFTLSDATVSYTAYAMMEYRRNELCTATVSGVGYECQFTFKVQVVRLSDGSLLPCSSATDPSDGRLCNFAPPAVGQYKLKISVSAPHFAYSGAPPTLYPIWVDVADVRPGNSANTYPVPYQGVTFYDANSAYNFAVQNGQIQDAGHGVWGGNAIGVTSASNLLFQNLALSTNGLDGHALLASDGAYLTLKDSTVNSNTPYVTNRMNLATFPVVFQSSATGSDHGKVHNVVFNGGNGAISLMSAKDTEIDASTFHNNPVVSNHFGITTWYANTLNIHDNVFQGTMQGILLSEGTKYAQVHHNTFDLTAFPCDAEYPTQLSTPAIRLVEYAANPLHSSSSNEHNWVYANTVRVNSFAYPDYPSCRTSAIGLHLSTPGYNNSYSNNSITTTSDAGSDAYSLYGGTQLAAAFGNTLSSNQLDAWLGNYYDPDASNSVLEANTFVRTGTDARFHAIQIGVGGSDLSWGPFPYTGLAFINNTFGSGTVKTDLYYSTVPAYGTPSTDYAFQWYLAVRATTGAGAPAVGAAVQAVSSKETVSATTDANGLAYLKLSEYKAAGSAVYSNGNSINVNLVKTPYTPHAVTVTYQGTPQTQTITMDAGKSATFVFGSAQTCAQLGGRICTTGQSCNGGSFQYASDSPSLCCVGGTCANPTPTPTVTITPTPTPAPSCPAGTACVTSLTCAGTCASDGATCLDKPGDSCPSHSGGTQTVTFRNGVNGYTGTSMSVLNQYAPTSPVAEPAYADIVFSPYSDSKALLRFDVSSIASNALVSSASLKVYGITPATAGPGNTKLFKLLTAWTSSAATWNSPWQQPGAEAAADASLLLSQTLNVGENVLSLTAAVQQWVSTPTSNNGVLLSDQDPVNVRLGGTNYWVPSQKPELDVTYSTPSSCTQNWQCSAWSVCLAGTQTRQCADLQDCGNPVSPLPLTQSCSSTPTPTVTVTVTATPSGCAYHNPDCAAGLVCSGNQCVSPVPGGGGGSGGGGSGGGGSGGGGGGTGTPTPKPTATLSAASTPAPTAPAEFVIVTPSIDEQLAQVKAAGEDTQEIELLLQQSDQLRAQGRGAEAATVFAKAKARLQELVAKVSAAKATFSWQYALGALAIVLLLSLYYATRKPPKPPAENNAQTVLVPELNGHDLQASAPASGEGNLPDFIRPSPPSAAPPENAPAQEEEPPSAP